MAVRLLSGLGLGAPARKVEELSVSIKKYLSVRRLSLSLLWVGGMTMTMTWVVDGHAAPSSASVDSTPSSSYS